uniref:Integrase, catalytic region, zinc finger, CCHC-type, peptidase aspartic, catalytic n=1 Tax=Tanacetum cinerariifolium TaxID=118510 RepID=A0A699H4E8_TANCI|nr:hypothetical protein [Tanacetum cinerariifolium]
MSTPITTSTTDNQMHNNIMAAGSKDHPPMLATRRYAQWQSRFMRYINTRLNGEALKKCILQGPYKLSYIIIPGLPAIDESLEVPERTAVETFSNISPENKAHYDAEKEAIHLLLTRIGDKIYSVVDACKTAHDIDGESIESYYSRFYKMMNEMIAKNANPLALITATQQYPDPYYQAPQSHKSYAPPSKQSSSTISHASTRYKGKEIAKPVTPLSESASEEDNDPKQAQRDKDMQKNLALIAKYFKKTTNIPTTTSELLQTPKTKNVDTALRYGDEIRLGSLRIRGHKLIGDKDEEIDKQELEAHYSFMAKIKEVLPAESRSDADPLEKLQYNAEYNVFANERQHSKQPESINDTHVVEKDDNNVIPDSSNMCDTDN